MSENSELIHWHLQRRSAALFGGAAREGGPVVANSALPHPQQQLGCHLPLEASRLRRERGGVQGLMKNARSVLSVQLLFVQVGPCKDLRRDLTRQILPIKYCRNFQII